MNELIFKDAVQLDYRNILNDHKIQTINFDRLMALLPPEATPTTNNTLVEVSRTKIDRY